MTLLPRTGAVHTVTVEHSFETGHRLPHLKGKCENLHGHSWYASVTVAAPELSEGIVVDFGALKKQLRGWIDAELDHGLMLGATDELGKILGAYGKVFLFGEEEHTTDLLWPSVENVAVLLARVTADILDKLPRSPGAYVQAVEVSETRVNRASWQAGP